MASLGSEATIMAHKAASQFGDGMIPEMAAAFGMNVGKVSTNFDHTLDVLQDRLQGTPVYAKNDSGTDGFGMT